MTREEWEDLQPLLRQIPLSDIDVIEEPFDLGFVFEYATKGDAQAFFEFFDKLVARGVPQVTKHTAFVYAMGDRENYIFPYWSLHGAVSKAGQRLASQWMHDRGVSWNKDDKPARKALLWEITLAFQEREPLPPLGLHVRRFLFVKAPWLIKRHNPDCLSRLDGI